MASWHSDISPSESDGQWVAAAYACMQPRPSALWQKIVSLLIMEVENFLATRTTK